MKNRSEDIPDNIAPEGLLQKLHSVVKIRETYSKEGVMYEQCKSKFPAISKYHLFQNNLKAEFISKLLKLFFR